MGKAMGSCWQVPKGNFGSLPSCAGLGYPIVGPHQFKRGKDLCARMPVLGGNMQDSKSCLHFFTNYVAGGDSALDCTSHNLLTGKMKCASPSREGALRATSTQ